MACFHKFYDDLQLERLDFIPTTLIVGTFNPAWPEGNPAEWFYGRVPNQPDKPNEGNHFWSILPQIYGQASMKYQGAAPAWKAFCRQHGIAITDLISQIKDADIHNPAHHKLLRSYSDRSIATKFKEFEPTPITDVLRGHPSIKSVYLTRGTDDLFWKSRWQPVQEYCDERRIHHRTLLTPCDYARIQYGRYIRKHPQTPKNREGFIMAEWKKKWHFHSTKL